MDMERKMHQQVVDDLYVEALALADEARARFDLRERAAGDRAGDMARVALSIEGLKTTTRIMHVLAWLLNQRAYQSGELTKLQLLRHGTLGEERPSDPGNMQKLDLTTRSLIRDTERLHARVARLDSEMRQLDQRAADPVRSMQGRIAEAFAAS